ncbi:MAG: hypothetical protein V3U35_04905, partial [Candidatus Neomarinimicrobiota bacterium]
AAVRPGLEGATLHEAGIISRLAAREVVGVPGEIRVGAAGRPRGRWGTALLVVAVAVAAVWLSQDGRLARLGRDLSARLGRPVPALSAPRPAPISGAAVMVGFLEALPAGATIEFSDAAAGLFIYWVRGEALARRLGELNLQVDGYRFSDLVVPLDDAAPGRWLGTVAYASADQEGALRPVKAEYERFFHRLQNNIATTGGMVIDMVPGTLTAGEYVIQGSLSELLAHLAVTAADSREIHYHRVSLLRQGQLNDGTYLLRVIFNLIEERDPSPRSSSPAGTGV